MNLVQWLGDLFGRRKRAPRRNPVRARPAAQPATKRAARGASARAQAFAYFAKGLRPSELPDLRVKRATLYRYFQSWKTRDRFNLLREWLNLMAEDPATAGDVAGVLNISSDQALTLMGARNPEAAVNAIYRAELVEMGDAAEQGWTLSRRRFRWLRKVYWRPDRARLLARIHRALQARDPLSDGWEEDDDDG